MDICGCGDESMFFDNKRWKFNIYKKDVLFSPRKESLALTSETSVVNMMFEPKTMSHLP